MDTQKDLMIRLLIVEDSLHDAEQIVSLLRSTGLHVKAEFAEDTEDMCKVLSSKSLDLVLFSIDLPDFTMKQCLHLIQECGKHISLIGMTLSSIKDNIVKAIDGGAQDLINPSNREHFVHVIKREMFHISTWRQTMSFETELHESEKRCQSLLANSKDAVAYVHEGMHIYANDAYLELYGFPDLDSIEGMPIMDLAHSDDKNALKQMLRQVGKQENKEHFLELSLHHNSGEYIKGRIEFTKASYDGERCTQILIRSQADTAELEEQINYLHQHDLVTGAFNRPHFMAELKTAINNAINREAQCAILYMSIDHFSTIRDSLGVAGCDILLADLATILKAHASEKNMVARFGNNSFVSICYSNDKTFVEELGRSLPQIIEQNISEVNGKSVSVTISISICYVDENAPSNANEIIARCEKTIVQIKENGGNSMQVYMPTTGEMTQDEEDQHISLMIKNAIKSKMISPLYQPVVSIGGGAGAVYSTFIELKDEHNKTHQQEAFMPSAERAGIAKNLDRWIIMNAIKQIAASGKNKLSLIIRLSQDSLLDPSLVRWIAECLNTARISGDSLIFMISETDAVNQLKASKMLFKGLKQLHCQFGLDEFGMGLNPFQLVKHIKADIICINQGYMENLSANPDNQNSIRELTKTANSLDIKTIAPIVSDASVLSVLWGLGTDYAQGDFLQPVSSKLNYDFSSMGG